MPQRLIRFIPNLLTLCNLLSGVAAVVFILYRGDSAAGALFILLGALFDLLDGLAARMLRASSPIGADLDSLADVVTFGLAPAVLALVTTEHRLLQSGWGAREALWYAVPFLLIVPFAAYRLAKFNNDTGSSVYFRGLPVPANALLWIGMFLSCGACAASAGSLAASYLLLAVTCGLMVSGVPMLSLKHLPAQLRSRRGRLILSAWIIILLIGGAALAVSRNYAYALRTAILAYLIVSILLSGQIVAISDEIDTAPQDKIS